MTLPPLDNAQDVRQTSLMQIRQADAPLQTLSKVQIDEAMTLDGLKWGATLMPKVRTLMDAHLVIGQRSDTPRGMRVPETPKDHEVSLYWGSSDFADLHRELRRDVQHDLQALGQRVRDLTMDFVMQQHESRWGGAFYMSFDHMNQPEIVINTQFQTWPPEDHWSDPSIRPHPEFEGMSLMKVKGFSLYWWLEDQHEQNADGDDVLKVAGYAQVVSAGGSWRTSNYPSAVCSEAFLLAWMATSRGLQMVNRVEKPAGQMVPPRVRAQQKMTRKHQASKVTIVSLRKKERGQIEAVQEAERQHLSHRFIVRGHWRQQPVGKGRLERRLTYISPFVKGPDGAPFMSKDKVYKW